MSSRSMETLERLDDVVRSRAFQDKCEDFFEDNTSSFEGCEVDGENKLEWTPIHEDYVKLVEAELNDVVGEERIEDLCDDLQNVMESGESESFAEAISLLTNFSDFLTFKRMMIGRTRGTSKPFETLSGTDNGLGDGVDASGLGKVFEKSLRLYDISRASGWKTEKESDVFTFSTLKGFEGDRGSYAKFVFVVDLPAKEHLELWTKFGPSRDKWDKTMMTETEVLEDYNAGRDTDDVDVLVECVPTMIPKLMRWAMGFKGRVAFRIATKSLPDGSIIYTMILWDVKGNCPDKKHDYEETGIVKPHPNDDRSSYLVSVSKLSKWTPTWVLGKLTESSMQQTKDLASAYREYNRR